MWNSSLINSITCLEGGATRAPICIELKRDGNLSSKSIVLQIDSKSQPVSTSALRHSLQDRLSKVSSKSQDEIFLKLKTSTSPPLKLIDLPGVDKGNLDDSLIRSRMKIRLPSLLSGLQGKSQVFQDESVRLGESMVTSSEGTRALALELCREFEDKFLQHIMTREGSGWKVVASFEGNFPNRIKQLPLDRHFDLKNVKRIVLEADGYQPYLISLEKGLRSLIKGVLELAKEPSRLCVDENDAKTMVTALVDMERVFVPPQLFIRLVQGRMDR
ncbi:hypothetical protein L2E82_52416 [Cichorium intybus]|nr:hypothetical protein L2E82_52416 [Cichorium intybus]